MGEEPDTKAAAAAAAAADRDRRTSARHLLEMWVEEIGEHSQVFRRAGNFSRGGMYLDQTIPLPVGSRVQFRFTLPGDSASITVTAQIVSISAAEVLGMGCKFVDVTPEIQERIDAYLKRAAGT